MRKKGWSFERFYTHEFYSQLLSRLEHQSTFSVSSKNIIDQLSNHISDILMKKYRLYGMEFISLLADQFYNITPNKYRILLEKFVNNNHEGDRTLQKFHFFHGLTSVLSTDDNRKFAHLFKIYCTKLRGTNQSSKKSYNISNQQQISAFYTQSPNQRQSDYHHNYFPYQTLFNVDKQHSIIIYFLIFFL